MTNRGLNPIEAAELLGCSPDQVIAFVKSGELKAYNIGRGQQRARYRIAESEIDAFRQRRSNGTVERRQQLERMRAEVLAALLEASDYTELWNRLMKLHEDTKPAT